MKRNKKNVNELFKFEDMFTITLWLDLCHMYELKVYYY